MINIIVHNFYSNKKNQLCNLHIISRLYFVPTSVLNSQYYTFNSHTKVENILNRIKINLINCMIFKVTSFTDHNIFIHTFTLYY